MSDLTEEREDELRRMRTALRGELIWYVEALGKACVAEIARETLSSMLDEPPVYPPPPRPEPPEGRGGPT